MRLAPVRNQSPLGGSIGIAAAVTHWPLLHHRKSGSVYDGKSTKLVFTASWGTNTTWYL
jgi:hypothetical protein